jgi:hypothetical protein
MEHEDSLLASLNPAIDSVFIQLNQIYTLYLFLLNFAMSILCVRDSPPPRLILECLNQSL